MRWRMARNALISWMHSTLLQLVPKAALLHQMALLPLVSLPQWHTGMHDPAEEGSQQLYFTVKLRGSYACGQCCRGFWGDIAQRSCSYTASIGSRRCQLDSQTATRRPPSSNIRCQASLRAGAGM